MTRALPETDPEQIDHGCWVCGVDCGVGEAGLVKWAEHRTEADHMERVDRWQREAEARFGGRA
jgi:hypothetical protein